MGHAMVTILIRRPDGSESNVYADPRGTVLQLKSKIQEDLGVPEREQRLILVDRELTDDEVVGEIVGFSSELTLIRSAKRHARVLHARVADHSLDRSDTLQQIELGQRQHQDLGQVPLSELLCWVSQAVRQFTVDGISGYSADVSTKLCELYLLPDCDETAMLRRSTTEVLAACQSEGSGVVPLAQVSATEQAKPLAEFGWSADTTVLVALSQTERVVTFNSSIC